MIQTVVRKTVVRPVARKFSSRLAYDEYKGKDFNSSIGSDSDSHDTIVYLHGILGRRQNWRTPCNVWLKAHPTFKCIALDHRGHGESHSTALSAPHTVEACSYDLESSLSSLTIETPSILLGHSFGGKVALKYLENRWKVNKQLPKHTWIIDSIPDVYIENENRRDSKDSVFKVLDVLFDPGFPKVFQSREWMLQHLTNTHKLDKSIALWLLTSVAPSLEVKGSFTWTLDFKVIELLFKDFCQQSMLEFLSDYDGDGSIHFLRAGRNMQWSREIIDEINSMQSNRIHLHTMPDVGHWVHSEDLHGMYSLIDKAISTQK